MKIKSFLEPYINLKALIHTELFNNHAIKTLSTSYDLIPKKYISLSYTPFYKFKLEELFCISFWFVLLKKVIALGQLKIKEKHKTLI